jgi:stage II sporulation protein D
MMKIKKEPIINVGILLHSTIHFELKGNFLLKNRHISSGKYAALFENKKILTAFAKSDETIELIPESKSSTFILKNVTIGIGFHWERKEDQEFEGGLIFRVEGDKIRVINSIPLESYLESVISSEMSAMNDLNLLNAHSIVSRSWLLAQIQNRGKCHPDCLPRFIGDEGGRIQTNLEQIPHSFASLLMTNNNKEIVKWYDREDHETFDVCADDHCQRYQGITKVISENAKKAIEATHGKVLIYDHEICDARFSKCCGGISEDFENVWQPVEVPYLVAVRDMNTNTDRVSNPVSVKDETYFKTSPEAFCNTSDIKVLNQVLIDFDRTTTNFYRWTVTYSQQELSVLIAKKSGIDFGEILDLVPLERGNSGRLIRLKIIGSKKELIIGKELEIRKWLSESHLYSSAFIVEKEFAGKTETPSNFVLRGAGWGHGVGMCQIGATVMSRKGYTPNQILEHYFSGATIKSIY